MFTLKDIENNKNIKRKNFIYQDYKIYYYTDGTTIAITNNGINDIEDSLIYFNTLDELKRFVDGYTSRRYYFEDIKYIHNDILLNYTNNIAYHLSDINNKDSILKQGLIAGKNGSTEILKTSLLMDLNKPDKIPKNFCKTAAIYLYPKFTEWINETESDLYGVDISDLNYYVGSFTLSGFALSHTMEIDWENEEEIKDTKYIDLYWNNFYSKDEFLKNTPAVKQSKEQYGLTELLVQFQIHPSRIIHIGTFSLGRFLPNKNFVEFVKPQYKDSYRKILREHLTR